MMTRAEVFSTLDVHVLTFEPQTYLLLCLGSLLFFVTSSAVEIAAGTDCHQS